MKKIISSLLLLFLVINLQAGLVCGIAFNEGSGTKANDLSGNGNNATINGATWTPGKYGQGLLFNGTSAYLLVSNSTTLDVSGTALTFSMWLYPQALSGGDSVVFGKFYNVAMDYPYYQYGLELAGGNLPNFFLGSGGNGNNANNSTIPYNTWTHVACTFDGTTMLVYINGVQNTDSYFPVSITKRSQRMHIGADANTSQFYKGKMDEFRVYNTVLSAAQIVQDMNTPIGPSDTNAPTVPSGLKSSAVTFNSVNFSWNASTDNVAVDSYEVQRNGVLVSSPTTTNYVDSGLAALTTYTYRVRAKDASGNYSAYSTNLSVTTLVEPPPPPTFAVTLAWDRSPDTNVNSYVMYHGAGSRQYTNSANVGNVTTNVVRGLLDNVTYYFAVTAKAIEGLESDFSNEVSYRSGTSTNLVTLPATNITATSAKLLGKVSGITNWFESYFRYGTNYTNLTLSTARVGVTPINSTTYVSNVVSSLTGKTWYYKACLWSPSNGMALYGDTLSFNLTSDTLPAPTELKIFKVESIKK